VLLREHHSIFPVSETPGHRIRQGYKPLPEIALRTTQRTSHENKMRQTKLSIVKLTKQLDRLTSSSDQKEEVAIMVEIIGLEMLEERIPVILDDHRSIADDDSSEAESDSFANDSVELAIKKRSAGRTRRRGSNESFSKDSLKLAKIQRRQRTGSTLKDTIPVQILSISPLKNEHDSLDAKNIGSPNIMTPDDSTMKAGMITNSAAA
jgi:hypothetical protein